VNGDGYSDVIVGAPRTDITTTTALTDTGMAFVYYGGPSGIVTDTVWTANPTNQAHARFGSSASTAGDVNGDGYADVIIAANGYDGEETNEGAAFVYHGGPTGLATTPAWTIHPVNQAYANFGRSASTAGDVNSDGYSDVIVGAPWYDPDQTDEDRDRGSAYVYLGRSGGLNSGSSWTIIGDRREAEFGIAVSAAGDVNGDGCSDVVVGAYKYTEDSSSPWREGAVFVYHGGPAGPATSPAWSARSGQESAKYGVSVATIGDVNGDGYADIAVGAYNYDGGQPREGAAFVYYGGSGGLVSGPAWSAEGDQEGAGLGYAVAAAGDVNGDGYGDLVAGAPTYNDGETDEGAAFVYLGAGAGGLSANPRQLRSYDLTPIAPLGFSDSANSVHLHLTAQLTQTTLAKLQWQLAPLGVPFDASTAISGTSPTWISVPTTAILSQTVSGLTGDTLYRWRVRMVWPGDTHSRWLYLSWNGPQEADFRTPSLLGPDWNVYLGPGESTTSTLTLFNPVGGSQTFTLTYTSSPGYTATVATPSGGSTVTLSSFERSPVTITVQTDPTTPMGSRYTTVITATSDLSGQHAATHVTTVAELLLLPLVMRSSP
jgi:hypothetical protein